MSLASILIGLAMLVIVVPIVADPFRHPERQTDRKPRGGPTGRPTYPAVLRALRDLDFDHQTGKVSEEDYARVRGELLVQAAEAMQAAPGETDVEAMIEAEVRRLRLEIRSDPTLRCAGCGNNLQKGDRFCPACGRAAGVHCPDCGEPVQDTDRFCTRCGAPLGVTAKEGSSA